jgi:hypothetical protein
MMGGIDTAAGAMDAAGHDGFDERSNVLVFYSSLAGYFMESSSVGTVSIISCKI